jgi:ABC-type multidrug transport system fused ATPase/permease subunit
MRASIKKGIISGIKYLKPHLGLGVANIVVLVITSLLEGLGVGMIIPIIQFLEKNESSNIFMSYAFWLCGFIHVTPTFVNLLIIFCVITLLGFAMRAWQRYINKQLQLVVTYDLRKKAFQNLMDVPLKYYYKKKVGDIISTVYTSAANAGSTLYYGIDFIIAMIFCCIYIVINFLISAPMTLIAFALAVLSYFFVIPRFKSGFIRGQEEKNVIDEFSSFLLDKLSGIKTIKSFNAENKHKDQFNAVAAKYNKTMMDITVNRIIATLCLEPILTILIAVLVILAIEVFHISVAMLIAFIYVFTRMVPKISMVNSNYLQIMELAPHFLETEKLIRSDDKEYIKDGTVAINGINQSIRVENVFFKYNPEDNYALEDISIEIIKGKTTAIVGGSGGGKTTLIGLLMRYHDPQQGRVLVDGIDLRQIKRKSWSKYVSIVEQDPYLFHDTIYNNILYGKDGVGKDEVVSAANLAHAHEFIIQLPQGYDTIVGERGIKLSGGQKQRIVLARALIRDPEILILDEATSSLDSESEQFIKKSIDELGKLKTIVVIAHRLSTVIKADKLVVMENAKIVEVGTHKDLLEKKGAYEKYYRLQHEAPI